jgi:hypothetical protein
MHYCQPDCKPIFKMLKLWRESEQASGIARPQMRVITKSAFLELSEEERGCLLEDFIVIKDTNASPDFLPEFV